MHVDKNELKLMISQCFSEVVQSYLNEEAAVEYKYPGASLFLL